MHRGIYGVAFRGEAGLVDGDQASLYLVEVAQIQMGNSFSECRGTVSTAPTGSLVAVSPTLVVIAPEAPRQLTLIGKIVEIQGGKRKRK